MSPEPRRTSVRSGILIHPAVWPQHTWAENWADCMCPSGRRGAGSPSNSVARAEAYLHAKFPFHPFNRLATTPTSQTGQDRQDRTTVRYHTANHFTNGRPKNDKSPHLCNGLTDHHNITQGDVSMLCTVTAVKISNFLKFKMAGSRHLENRKIAICR